MSGSGTSPNSWIVTIVGGLVVVGAIVWVQTQRLQLEAELAPAYRARRRRAPKTPVE